MTPYLEPSHPLLFSSISEVKPDEVLSEEIQMVIDQMYEIAAKERRPGSIRGMVGLAAPQVGIDKRIILVDIGFNDVKKEWGELKVYINPQIVWRSEEQLIRREGCYSVDAHINGILSRAERVKIVAIDRNGDPVCEEFSGLTARIFQHEIDHLDGIRFPDRVGSDGVLNWIEEEQFPEYRENWQNWPVKCPWDVWIKMKEGKPFEHPSQENAQKVNVS